MKLTIERSCTNRFFGIIPGFRNFGNGGIILGPINIIWSK